MTKRYAVFASYSKDGTIKEDVLFYLKELNKITDGIIFVSDNNSSEEEIKKLKGLTLFNIVKRHNEYDFGSYKRGFLYLLENGFLENTKEIIFANDSCFGPLRRLRDFIYEYEKQNKPDLFGVTINNYGYKTPYGKFGEIEFPHIQSYFFLVQSSFFKKSYFIDFLKNVKHFDNKIEIIINYEMGLTDLCLKNNLKIGSFFNFKNLKLDPTVDDSYINKTVGHGFFLKKKIYKNLDQNKINFFLYKSIFPFNIKDDILIKKKISYLFKYPMQVLFSVKNKDNHKILSILGIKIKFKKRKVYDNMNLV